MDIYKFCQKIMYLFLAVAAFGGGKLFHVVYNLYIYGEFSFSFLV